MFKILNKIFSIKDDNLRFVITFCGIKFRIQKRKYANLRKQNPYYLYKKNNVDITTLPPATGDFRNFQLATLSLLVDFDSICKQYNLHYWLDFGTLIGAVRHKGFIPWDDDIDICMFREDYEKVINIVNNSSLNKNIYAEYHSTFFIKIKHKKCSCLFLDIFPVDKYGKKIPDKKQLQYSKKIKKISKLLHKNGTIKDKEKTKKYLKEAGFVNEISKDRTKIQYIWGIDYCHGWKNWFTDYDIYFPFKTITFENYEFPCMNNPEAYLKKVYGDFMSYPSKMRLGHNIFKERSLEDKVIIEDLANKLTSIHS